MRIAPVTAAAFFVIAAACSSGTGEPAGVNPSQAGQIDLDAGGSKTTPDGPSGLPCNVDKILADNCRKCHSDPPQYGAPMPLLTWDNLHAAASSDGAKKVYERAAVRIDDDTSPMPQPPNARLSEADRSVIRAWAAAGAPKSSESCETTGKVDPTTNLSCPITKTLEPGGVWEMPEELGDQYVCWGVDVTADTPTHIVGLSPRIDNTKIVHHVVMYEASSSYPSVPQKCDAGTALTWRMVLGWAPGVKGIETPPEAGFPIKATGSHYVVQMHYSNLQHLKGEKDKSAIDLCTSAPRKYEADVVAFGTQDIKIPEAPPAGGIFTRNCALTIPSLFKGIHMFASMPHMHQAGVKMSTTLTRKDGTVVDLGTMDSYDFNRQAWLPINDAVTEEGDVIRTKCGYTNRTGKEISFGEKTSDEMCYSFTMYYPRITTPLWSWALPTLDPKYGGATCVSEP